jgi:C1A family cysteine protease
MPLVSSIAVPISAASAAAPPLSSSAPLQLATFAWSRDLPDFRDVSPSDAAASLTTFKRRSPRAPRPDVVDLREFFGPVVDAGAPNASSAAAVLAMTQYFERRTSGRLVESSTAFLHYTARRLAGIAGDQPVSLRAALKALVRFGCPTARTWPQDHTRGDAEPDAFAYGFQRDFADLHYLRLDTPGLGGAEVLKQVKSFVAAGFACVGGVSLPDSAVNTATSAGEIPYPTAHDTIVGSAALTVVGYDDAYRIRSQKGALRIRGTFGPAWGDAGYGWLPYRYVEQSGACDFWTLVKPAWSAARELEQPR